MDSTLFPIGSKREVISGRRFRCDRQRESFLNDFGVNSDDCKSSWIWDVSDINDDLASSLKLFLV